MAKPLDQKPKDEMRQYMKDVLDLLFKAVGYLLAANAAGLAGSITLLKDYETVPQLKGIGIFISLFGFGFLSAVLAFLGIIAVHQAWHGVSMGFDKGPSNPQFYMALVYVPSALSVFLLVNAVSLMIWKFIWL